MLAHAGSRACRASVSQSDRGNGQAREDPSPHVSNSIGTGRFGWRSAEGTCIWKDGLRLTPILTAAGKGESVRLTRLSRNR